NRASGPAHTDSAARRPVIARLSELALHRSRRVLIVSGVLFVVAAAIGAPVVSILGSESSDFQDPAAQNQQVLRAIERATGQSADYGVVALVPTSGPVHEGGGARDATARAARVASLLAAQRGFQRALDYPATHLPQLISR